MRLRRMKLKIVVVGERAVGKTSLLQRYVQNHFDSAYHGTLGAFMYPVQVEVLVGEQEVVQASIALFDLMGEHSIRETFRDAMFYGTHGVLAVCDVERPETLYAIDDWFQAVSLVTGGVPFGVAFNKVDRLSKVTVGPAETSWLRKRFPLVPTTMTSAMTGTGVEDVFSGLIGRVIESTLSAGRRRRVQRVVRQKILAFVTRRGLGGVSKSELLFGFKELDYNELMAEIDNLVRLDVLSRDELGPGTFRVRATHHGQEIAASTLWEELVIDEPA